MKYLQSANLWHKNRARRVVQNLNNIKYTHAAKPQDENDNNSDYKDELKWFAAAVTEITWLIYLWYKLLLEVPVLRNMSGMHRSPPVTAVSHVILDQVKTVYVQNIHLLNWETGLPKK